MEHERLPYRRVTIIGLGTIGCSIAALLRGQGIADEIVGMDRNSLHLENARHLGFIQRGVSLAEGAVLGASVNIIAVPLDELFLVMQQIGPALKPGSLVVDTAGTTYKLWQEIESRKDHLYHYVPSFPRVFTQHTGPAGGSVSLLKGSCCFVPHVKSTLRDAEVALQFWRSVGLVPQIVDWNRFEQIVATGHLFPSLVAQQAQRWIEQQGWDLPQTPLETWLSIVSKRDDPKERCFQLYAHVLRPMLSEWIKSMNDMYTKLGGDKP